MLPIIFCIIGPQWAIIFWHTWRCLNGTKLVLRTAASGSISANVDRVLWLVDGEEYIGQASIRPELCTDYLITYGGHIGYSIRPSRRRRGYGKEILGLTLGIAAGMDLERVLVTCDSDNFGSKKIIEHNGGVFEYSMKMTGRAFRVEGRSSNSEVEKLRYWIDLPNGRLS